MVWVFVAFVGALILAGILMLAFLPATTALARKRWEASYRPQDPPAEGGPATGMIVAQAVVWILFGGLFLVIVLGAASGAFVGIDEVAQRRVAGFFFGAFFTGFSVWVLVRGPKRVADDMDVQSRVMSARPPLRRQHPVLVGVAFGVCGVIGVVVFVAFGILGL